MGLFVLDFLNVGQSHCPDPAITNRRVRRLPHDPKRIISEEIHAPSILSSRPLNRFNSSYRYSIRSDGRG